MPRRKTNLGRRTRHTERSRRRLSNMTEEERACVREKNRLSTIQTRNAETADRRAARLEDARLRARQARSAAAESVRSQRKERKVEKKTGIRTQRAELNHAFGYNPAVENTLNSHIVINQISDVYKLNNDIQSSIQSDDAIYKTTATVVETEEDDNNPIEILSSVKETNKPEHIPKLEIGVTEMLRNVNKPKLCNVTRLAVKKLMKNVVETTFLTRPFKEYVLSPSYSHDPDL